MINVKDYSIKFLEVHKVQDALKMADCESSAWG